MALALCVVFAWFGEHHLWVKLCVCVCVCVCLTLLQIAVHIADSIHVYMTLPSVSTALY